MSSSTETVKKESPKESRIEIRNLQFAYFEEGKNTLDGVDASFSGSEITVLTGKSGCGKSTLLYVTAGLYPHNAGVLRGGSVTVDGKELRHLEPRERCGIAGMMFQNPDLQFCMDTVRNEMIFCLENTGDDPADFEDRIDRTLDFCGIPELKNRTLHTLSGGEKQRVALACVILQQPSWLLLDEPFANVDDSSAREILQRLKELHEKFGIGILAVDHRPENWIGIADSWKKFEDGRISDVSAPEAEAAVGAQGDVRADFLSQESESYVQGKAAGSNAVGSKASAAEQAEISAKDSSSEIITDPPAVLTLENVSVMHEKKGTPYLSGINCSFRKGRSYAVVGESGCGKSTFFGAIEGLYPWKGSIRLDGMDLKKYRKKSFGRIGFVTQNPQDQFIGGSVRHEVMTALRGVPDAEEKCREILKSIHLWKYRDVSPYMLSQGQQRRLGVAVLMAYPCEVLICDEPTYAQDPENTEVIMRYLLAQVEEHDVTLIFSTHDPAVAKRYGDEILEIRNGTLEVKTTCEH